jgi:hypothetical protein
MPRSADCAAILLPRMRFPLATIEAGIRKKGCTSVELSHGT